MDVATNVSLIDAAMAATVKREKDKEYLQLRRLIVEHGLLKRQYGYYAMKITSALGLLGISIAVLVMVSSVWVQVLNATFLALVFTQFGMLGHDSGHRQIFKSARRNDFVLLMAGLVTGMTPSWWQDKHNTHHRNPNQIDLDGDIEVSLFAFTEEQALATKGLFRFAVKYQAYFFYPLLVLTSISLLFGGIAYQIRREKVRYPILEPVLVLLGLAVYLGLIFYFLPPWQAGLFVVVHRALGGIYFGSVFAPNHKGMPVLDKDNELDFIRQQALTARNVRPGLIADFWYGGLNFQIEHHLFPNMPRNQLKKAREIVRPFCLAHDIPYHETTVLQSNKEILGYMHEVSAPLRRKSA